MKIYRVFANMMTHKAHENYEVTVYEIEAKESAKSYNWKGSRISKEEIGVVSQSYNGNSNIGFYIYVKEDQLPDAEEKVINALHAFIENQLATFQTFKRMANEKPKKTHEILEENGTWKTFR